MAMEPSSRFSESLPDVAIADTVVPEWRKWPAHELSHVAHDDYTQDEIAVIDLQADDLKETRRGIREVFQVVNHGLSREQLDRMQTVSNKFFNFPLETKEKLECTPQGDRLLGYGFPRPSNLQTSRSAYDDPISREVKKVRHSSNGKQANEMEANEP